MPRPPRVGHFSLYSSPIRTTYVDLESFSRPCRPSKLNPFIQASQCTTLLSLTRRPNLSERNTACSLETKEPPLIRQPTTLMLEGTKRMDLMAMDSSSEPGSSKLSSIFPSSFSSRIDQTNNQADARWTCSSFRLNLVDLLTMAAMGAIGLGVYEAKPAPTRNFPIAVPGSGYGTAAGLGEVVYPQ